MALLAGSAVSAQNSNPPAGTPEYTPVHSPYYTMVPPKQANDDLGWNWALILCGVAVFFGLVSMLIYKRFSAAKRSNGKRKLRGRGSKHHQSHNANNKSKGRRRDTGEEAPQVVNESTTRTIPAKRRNLRDFYAAWSTTGMEALRMLLVRIRESALIAYVIALATQGFHFVNGTRELVWMSVVDICNQITLKLQHYWAIGTLSPTVPATPLDLNLEFSEEDEDDDCATVSPDCGEEYYGDSETKSYDKSEPVGPNDAIPTKQRRRRRSKAERRKALQEQLKLSKLGGLYNEGNTCFMNSVIQSLASLDSVDILLEELRNSIGEDETPSVVLMQLIHEINTKSLTKHTYSTSRLVEFMSQKTSRWRSSSQQDAQEFFQQVLSCLEKDVTSSLQDEEKPRVVTPFDGETAVRVGCLKCGEMEGIRKEVMSSVGLSLTATSEHVDLLDLLDEYAQLETIPGVECYRCSLLEAERELVQKLKEAPSSRDLRVQLAQIRETLKQPVIEEGMRLPTIKHLSSKSKQTMFAQPTARVLAIHINRSVFDPSTGCIRKNLTPVTFAAELDLAPYVVKDIKDVRNQNPRFPMISVRSRKRNTSTSKDYESDESDLDLDPRHGKLASSTPQQHQDEEEHDGPPLEVDSSVTESTMDNNAWSQRTTPNTSVGPSPVLLPTNDALPAVDHLDLASPTSAEAGFADTLKYKLKAIIVHYGTHNFGHYICYRRCRHGLWWQISDATVVQVDEATVLQAQGVFMLFYERLGEAKKREAWIKETREASAPKQAAPAAAPVPRQPPAAVHQEAEPEKQGQAAQQQRGHGAATTTTATATGATARKKKQGGARRRLHKGR